MKNVKGFLICILFSISGNLIMGQYNEGKQYFFNYDIVRDYLKENREELTIEINDNLSPIDLSTVSNNIILETNSTLDATWEEIGPVKDGTVKNDIGLIGYIGFPDPNNINKVFACSPAGGLFRSADGGASWFNAGTDQGLRKWNGYIAQCGVSYVAFDPADIDNIWYIATGMAHDTHPFKQSSDGIHRTIDGGQTWQYIGLATATDGCTEKHYINKIFVISSGHILVASADGLWECSNTLDGTPYGNPTGTPNFIKRINDHCFDIEQIPNTNKYFITTRGNFCTVEDPNDRLVLYVYDNNTKLHPTFTNGNNFAIRHVRSYHTLEISECDPGKAYILESKSQFHNLYRLTFTVGSGDNIQIQHMGQLWSGQNGLCPDALALSPTNKDILSVGSGGYKQGNGIITITDASTVTPPMIFPGIYLKTGYKTHVDINCITYSPDGSEIWAGTDGGVCKAVNNNDVWGIWQSKNNGLGVATMFNIDVNQASSLKVITGQQDMGACLLFKDVYGNWVQSHEVGGDGGPCLFNFNDDTEFISWPLLSAYRVLNSADPYTIYWVTSGVIQKGTWNPPTTYISGVPNSVAGDIVGNIAVSKNPAHSNYFYAGMMSEGKTKILKSTVGGGTNPSNWTKIECPYANTVGEWWIVVDYYDPNHIWVYHGWVKIYSVNTITNTWDDISYRAHFPFGSLIQDKETNSIYFTGLSYGMYYSENGSSLIYDYSGNLPNVEISESKINFTTRQIVAGTFGRGVWAAPLACNPSAENINVSSVTSDIFKHASNTITCFGLVASSKSVFLQAGNKIEFNPGFSTSDKCVMNAFVLPCGSTLKSTGKNISQPNHEFKKDINTRLDKDIFKAYPNPTTGKIIIELNIDEISNSSLEIYDMQGKVIDQQLIYTHETYFDFQDKKGVFIIRIIVNNASYITKIHVK